ncbi:hypothetical protein [Candidatus Ichthyocystis sparus]|uniref:hypothetical protein n=1 Tax=Candidatus Ichthyocystis sparus TaxID=1561004 RepID=UPI00159EE8CC|nr:hypothetical protein [Candidatus Ichthyocystis sparus]
MFELGDSNSRNAIFSLPHTVDDERFEWQSSLSPNRIKLSPSEGELQFVVHKLDIITPVL